MTPDEFMQQARDFPANLARAWSDLQSWIVALDPLWQAWSQSEGLQMLTVFAGLMLFGWIGSLCAKVEASHTRYAARTQARIEASAHRRRQEIEARRDAGLFGDASANCVTAPKVYRTLDVAECWLGPSQASAATLRLTVQARTRRHRRKPLSRHGRGRA